MKKAATYSSDKGLKIKDEKVLLSFVFSFSSLKKQTFFLFLFFTFQLTFAQNISINKDGADPDPSAMLDVSDTASGVLVPRLTQAQRDLIPNPATGLLIFQINQDSGFYFNQGIPTTPIWLRIQTEADTNLWSKNDTDIYFNGGFVGLGVDTPRAQLHLYGKGSLGAGSRLAFGDDYFYQGANNGLNVHIGESGWYDNVDSDQLQLHGKSGQYFTVNGTLGPASLDTSMFILSNGNVGIGNVSLNQKFGIYTDGARNNLLRMQADSGQAGLWFSNDSANWALFSDGYSSPILPQGSFGIYGGKVGEANAIRMLIDKEGQVGMGTTVAEEALHIQRSDTNTILLIDNPSGTYESRLKFRKFGSFTAALGFYPGTPDLRFRTSVGHITFEPDTAEAMRITTDGNVGIGTISPSDKLQLFSTGNVRVRTTSSTNGFSGIVSSNSLGEYFVGVQGAFDPYPGEFHIYQNAGSGNSGQRIVIDHQGRMGVSLSDPEGILSVSNATLAGVPAIFMDNFNASEGTIAVDSGEDMYFGDWDGTSFTENMRIEASGRVGINTNTTNARLTIQGTAGNLNSGLQFQNGTNDWYIFQNTSFGLTFRDDATDRLQIDPNGNLIPAGDNIYNLGAASFRWNDVYATNGTILTSDIRFKTEVKKLGYGLKEIMQINPITFKWKENTSPETKIGLSAQELLEILPEVVKSHEWEKDENGEWIKEELEKYGVYYTDLIPVLINAIQEQEAEIRALKEDSKKNQEDINWLKAEIKNLKSNQKP